MDKEHLFYRAECNMGIGTAVRYIINEEMTDWFAKQFPKIQKVFKQLGVEE